MRNLAVIMMKDLRQRSRDRSILVLGFLLPLALMWVFSLLFAEIDDSAPPAVTIGVANLEQGTAGGACEVTGGTCLGDALEEVVLPLVQARIEAEGGSAEVVVYDAATTLRRDVADGELDAGIVVPVGTTAALVSGEAQIEVVTVPERIEASAITSAIAEQFARQVKGQAAARVAATSLGLDATTTAELSAALGQAEGRVVVDASSTGGDDGGFASYLAGGMIVFFLFFTVGFGVLGYIGESEGGTMPRLLASPVRTWQVLGAKVVGSLLIGTVATAVLMATAVPLVGAQWGNPFVVAVLVLAVVVAATSLVAVVATVARTVEQANVAQSTIAILLGLLGGSFFPIEGGPEWIGSLSRLTPHGTFLDALQQTAAGAGLAQIRPNLVLLLGFAVTMVAIATVAMRLQGDE